MIAAIGARIDFTGTVIDVIVAFALCGDAASVHSASTGVPALDRRAFGRMVATCVELVEFADFIIVVGIEVIAVGAGGEAAFAVIASTSSGMICGVAVDAVFSAVFGGVAAGCGLIETDVFVARMGDALAATAVFMGATGGTDTTGCAAGVGIFSSIDAGVTRFAVA